MLQNIDNSNLKVQLINLNEDCQLLIFEKLSVTDLCSLSETSEYFSKIVAEVMRRKCAKKMVIFDTLSSSSLPSSSSSSSSSSSFSHSDVSKETNESIEIKNVETVVKFLTKFGRNIRNLKIAKNAQISIKIQSKKFIN